MREYSFRSLRFSKLMLIPKKFIGNNNNNNNNIFISYIKYTNITPPANSKANRGRWCVDGLRFITNS